MVREPIEPGFAPANPTDNRGAGDWESRYNDPVAKWWIRFEAGYLAVHLSAVVITVFCLEFFKLPAAPFSSVSTETALSNPLGWEQVLHAWMGGLLGGTIYATKWLYHVVAKNMWNVDRRLWRLFTPHLSGSLALSFVILLSSGLLVIVDRAELQSKWVCFAISFLVGYFSDNATAKMAEVAQTLFGAKKHTDSDSEQRQANP